MAQYRVIEINDKLISTGPYWRVEKKIFGLWWSSYFEEHTEWGATFYSREAAMRWWEYHTDKSSRWDIKVIAQK